MAGVPSYKARGGRRQRISQVGSGKHISDLQGKVISEPEQVRPGADPVTERIQGSLGEVNVTQPWTGDQAYNGDSVSGFPESPFNVSLCKHTGVARMNRPRPVWESTNIGRGVCGWKGILGLGNSICKDRSLKKSLDKLREWLVVCGVEIHTESGRLPLTWLPVPP